MFLKALVVLGYYLVAMAGVASLTFRDFRATRERVVSDSEGSGRLARGFLTRTSLLFGLAAGIGAVAVVELLMSPAPPVWIVLAVSMWSRLRLVNFGEISGLAGPREARFLFFTAPFAPHFFWLLLALYGFLSRVMSSTSFRATTWRCLFERSPSP